MGITGEYNCGAAVTQIIHRAYTFNKKTHTKNVYIFMRRYQACRVITVSGSFPLLYMRRATSLGFERFNTFNTFPTRIHSFS